MHSSLLALLSLLSAISVDASPTPLLMRRAPLRAIKRRSVPVRRQAPANYGPAPMGDVPADYKPVYQDGHIKVIGNGTFAFNPNATTSNNPKLGGGTGKTRTVPAKACFPGFGTAPTVPSTNATAASLKNWWCSQNDEYAFLGFSYSLSSCPSLAQLNTDFRNQRQTYNARYVRMYSHCDGMSTFQMYNNIVEAAATQGLGVYALVWFGFDGDDKYKSRHADLLRVIRTNPKAPYVIRNIAIGSEPLFDHALPVDQLASLITSTKTALSDYAMQVTLSEMPYGFQINNNAPQIFKAMDTISVNALPFFDSGATTGGRAWNFVSWNMDYVRQYGGWDKPLRLTQTGWPSNDSVWKANSPNAVASIESEKAYFDLLDSRCGDFKKSNSVGWFAHLYSDNDLPGWGILDNQRKPKFAFKPRTTC